MIATVAALAVAVLGYVFFERIRTEQILRIQDEYHLTSALAATSSELEIEHARRNIELLRELQERTGSDLAPEREIISSTRTSVFILRMEFARILAIQADYANPAFDALAQRLKQQDEDLGNVRLVMGMETQQLLDLEKTLLALQRTLNQLGRLHVVGHDTLQAQNLEKNRRGLGLLLAAAVAAFALSAYVIRRGFSAIAGLTSEQDLTAAALRESEQRTRDYATSSADNYWETNTQLEWRWTDTAQRADNPLLEPPVEATQVGVPNMADSLRSRLVSREPIRNVEIKDDSGPERQRWWRISGVPVFDDSDNFAGYRGVATDITEQKLMAEQSRQLQRIDAIGRLTGGVAHDFNNLLAVVLGNLELLNAAEDPEHNAEFIDAAISATMRGADLTKNLLSFARRATLAPKRVDQNTLARTTKNWAARVLPETIQIETSLLAGLWEVDVDPTSMESALLNLFLNARDAMPNGGKLTIETANMLIDEDYVLDRKEDLPPGRYVMLAATDTGHGIERRDLDQIFEPFFTTKSVGQGSGLGLSMVQGFVKQSGGAIRVYSELGGGTTFKLYFKASTESVARASDGKDANLPATVEGLRVLLVEDDQDVMQVLNHILTAAGFAITTATSGDQAFEFFERSSEPFEMVVTDIVMPGKLQGPGLAKAIRELAPDVPFIFISGYADEAVVHGNECKPEDIRLMKPVRRVDLLRAVAKALARTHEKQDY